MKFPPSLHHILQIALLLLLCLAAGWCAQLAARIEGAAPVPASAALPFLAPFIAVPAVTATLVP